MTRTQKSMKVVLYIRTHYRIEDLTEDKNEGKAGEYLLEMVEGQTADQRRKEPLRLEPEESSPLKASIDEHP